MTSHNKNYVAIKNKCGMCKIIFNRRHCIKSLNSTTIKKETVTKQNPQKKSRSKEQKNITRKPQTPNENRHPTPVSTIISLKQLTFPQNTFRNTQRFFITFLPATHNPSHTKQHICSLPDFRM